LPVLSCKNYCPVKWPSTSWEIPPEDYIACKLRNVEKGAA